MPKWKSQYDNCINSMFMDKKRTQNVAYFVLLVNLDGNNDLAF